MNVKTKFQQKKYHGQRKATALVIVAIATATALLVATSLPGNVLATKTVKKTCTLPSGTSPCPGQSGTHNPKHYCTVTAGSKNHIVSGQQKKVCP